MKHRILITFLCAALCYGQAPIPTGWTALASIDPGHKIRVETSTKKHTGTFMGASDECITLNTEDRQLSIPRGDVKRVYFRSHSHRLRNTLIGAGIGAAVGVITYNTLGARLRNEGGENTGPQLFMAPIGIGTGIGAAIPTGSMKKIYDANAETSRP